MNISYKPTSEKRIKSGELSYCHIGTKSNCEIIDGVIIYTKNKTMKRIKLLARVAIATIAFSVTSCAGLTFGLQSDYGDVSKDALGNVSFTLKTIVIPAK